MMERVKNVASQVSDKTQLEDFVSCTEAIKPEDSESLTEDER